MTFVLFHVQKKRLYAIHEVLMQHEHFAVSYIKNFDVFRALNHKIIVEVIESGMQGKLYGLLISRILMHYIVKTVKTRAIGPERLLTQHQ
jgi:hypothetical protein